MSKPKTEINRLTAKIERHKLRRKRHMEALLKSGITFEEKKRHLEGIKIQSSIVNKLKVLRHPKNRNYGGVPGGF